MQVSGVRSPEGGICLKFTAYDKIRHIKVEESEYYAHFWVRSGVKERTVGNRCNETDS